jgi:beta-galactosidase
MAGFPKDAYYMYQSEWTDKEVLHIFPHWNWEEGQKIDIWAYTNFDKVELFINGESQGEKSKENDQFSIRWKVKYEPGTLKAIGKNANGHTQEVEIKTSGAPAKIKLTADRETMKAGGKDLSFVTVQITDKDGIPVPYAKNEIAFKTTGEVKLIAVDNGNPTSHTSFQSKSIQTFNGKCLAILQAGKTTGETVLQAFSEGLEPATIRVQTEK